jgi:hypothetical protein
VLLNLNSVRDAADREAGYGHEDENDYRAGRTRAPTAGGDDPLTGPSRPEQFGEMRTMNPMLLNSLAAHERIREQLRREFPETDDETLRDTLEGLRVLLKNGYQ